MVFCIHTYLLKQQLLMMDADMSARFINTLIKSLQNTLHGCLDCDTHIELGGYVFVQVDGLPRFDYILNEQMHKGDSHCTTFHSNTYHAQQPEHMSQREGALRASSTERTSGHSLGTAPDGDLPCDGRLALPSFSVGDEFSSFSTKNNASKCSSTPDISGMVGTSHSTLLPINSGASDVGHNMSAVRKSPYPCYDQLQTSSHSGHFTGQLLPQQQQQKSEVMPDVADMDVIHIKTEEVENVFNDHYSYQHGQSKSSKYKIFLPL